MCSICSLKRELLSYVVPLLLEIWQKLCSIVVCVRLEKKESNYSIHLKELQKAENFDPSKVLVIDDLDSRLKDAKEHGYLVMKVSPYRGFKLTRDGVQKSAQSTWELTNFLPQVDY